MEFQFSDRSDGQVFVVARDDSPILSDALNDSVSSLPPRGMDVVGPSTYWVDVALAGLERALATGSERPFASGDLTLFRVRAGQIEARYDYEEEDVEGEFIAIDDFRRILQGWRQRIVKRSAEAVTALPDTYRRNPALDAPL